MLVPRMSAGIRSGVNWMREKSRSSVLASVRTSSVLPKPGHALQQAMAADEQARQHAVDDLVVSDDHAADLLVDGAVAIDELPGPLLHRFRNAHGSVLVGRSGIDGNAADGRSRRLRITAAFACRYCVAALLGHWSFFFSSHTFFFASQEPFGVAFFLGAASPARSTAATACGFEGTAGPRSSSIVALAGGRLRRGLESGGRVQLVRSARKPPPCGCAVAACTRARAASGWRRRTKSAGSPVRKPAPTRNSLAPAGRTRRRRTGSRPPARDRTRRPGCSWPWAGRAGTC